jgi:hypothetical protein
LYIADAAEFDVESSFVDVFGVFAAVAVVVVGSNVVLAAVVVDVGSNVVLAVVVVVDDDN